MSSTREQVRELLDEGLGDSEVARLLGLSPNTVAHHRRVLLEAVRAPKAAAVPPPPGARTAVRTRVRVAELLAAGASRAEIARRLGVSKSTVSYHARRLGEDIDERCARRYHWVKVQEHYDRGHSVRECSAAFGFSKQTWHVAVNRGDVVARSAAMTLEELCVKGVVRGRTYLKRRLFEAGLKERRCEGCDLAEWRGAQIPLALHHRNGVRDDNRLENLEILCANCHSQTDNFAGRSSGARRRAGLTSGPTAL